MANMIWFRWYRGTVEDGKFRIVARTVAKAGHPRVTVRDIIAVWAFLLEDATHETHRGVCTRDEAALGAILDLDDDVIETIMVTMEESWMISRTGDGIRILNWNKRQYENDLSDPTATERKRRQRARASDVNEPAEARAPDGDVTVEAPDGHGDVTAMSRQHPAQRQSTDPEAEVRGARSLPGLSTTPSVEVQNRGTSGPSKPMVGPPSDLDFSEFWQKYPHKIAKAKAEIVFNRLRQQGVVTQSKLMAGLSRYIADKPLDRHWCNPTTWLYQRRWNDQPAPAVAQRPAPGSVVEFKPRPPVRVAYEIPALSEAQWSKHLLDWSNRREWDRSVLGPAPLELNCAAPSHLFRAAGIRAPTPMVNFGDGAKPWLAEEPAPAPQRPPPIPQEETL